MTRPPDPFDFSDYSSSEARSDHGPHVEPDRVTGFSGGFDAPYQAPAPGFPPGGPASFGSHNPDGVFDNAGVRTPVAMTSTPIGWLIAAALVALVGLILALASFGSGPIAVAAWVVSGLTAIGVLAVFTVRDTKARAGAFYSQPVWVPWTVRVVFVLSCAGVLISAWNIADWIGRL